MKKRFYSLMVGDKYPVWYPEMLRENLSRWDCDLIVLTEQTTGFDSLGFTPPLSGWFCKWAFFNKNLFEDEQIIFVDLDTLFLKDPQPIFDYCSDPKTYRPLQFLACWQTARCCKKFMSPMMFIDFSTEWPDRVYHDLLKPVFPFGKWPGDDRYIREVVQRITGYSPMDPQEKQNPEIFGFMPPWFMGRYKIHHDFSPKLSACKTRWGDIPFDMLISMAFNGREDSHVVVSEKMPGWEIYAPFVQKYLEEKK